MLTRTSDSASSDTTRGWLARARRPAWLGQTIASVCWIVSVFAYGLEVTGDWLQLAAASSWLTANLAALVGGDD